MMAATTINWHKTDIKVPSKVLLVPGHLCLPTSVPDTAATESPTPSARTPEYILNCDTVKKRERRH